MTQPQPRSSRERQNFRAGTRAPNDQVQRTGHQDQTPNPNINACGRVRCNARLGGQDPRHGPKLSSHAPTEQSTRSGFCRVWMTQPRSSRDRQNFRAGTRAPNDQVQRTGHQDQTPNPNINACGRVRCNARLGGQDPRHGPKLSSHAPTEQSTR